MFILTFTALNNIYSENIVDDSQEIPLMEIDNQIWITDLKSPNGWLTDFLGQGYQEMKGELSIPELMKLMEYKYQQEFGG